MAKLHGHRSALVFSTALALLPWLGCGGGGSDPPAFPSGAAGTTGSAGTHGSIATDAGTPTGGAAGHGPGGSATNPPPSGSGNGGSIGPMGTGTGGNRGTAGAPSTAGTAGNTGAAGSPGTPDGGSAGSTGTVVITGGGSTTGTVSGTGGAGSTGAAGRAGSTGAAGAPGSTGTAGTTGTAGAPGSTGTAGTTGKAGTTGAAGATGAAGTTGTGNTTGTTGTGGAPVAGKTIKNVFVIAMENEPAAAIYGNKKAPYLNGLMATYAHATGFTDPLADSVPSEPHYVWMEAGTNKFSDVTFTDDGDPDSGNSTKSTAHLATQMLAASPPVSFMGAMEGLNSSTGTCPINSSGFYAAKHDPFIFFQDISGNPPSKSNALCSAHHQAFTTGQALVAGNVAQYTFISPNVCNDMHGDPSCPAGAGDVIATGDAWLAANLPPLIDYVNAHSGVIFIVWDEPEGGSNLIPFVAVGPGIKPGYTSTVAVTHSSLLKTVEEIFGLPVLPTVTSANDFADLFKPGMFP